jgi:hypothetical protein
MLSKNCDATFRTWESSQGVLEFAEKVEYKDWVFPLDSAEDFVVKKIYPRKLVSLGQTIRLGDIPGYLAGMRINQICILAGPTF